MSKRLERDQWFNEKEMAEVISAMDQKVNARDAFLVRMAFQTGMRISEILGLNVGDVHNKEFIDVRGKGGIVRRIPISDSLKPYIQKYLQYKDRNLEPLYDNSPLFMSQFHQRLSSKTVQKNIKRWARDIQNPRLNNFHQFRHSFLSFIANKCGVTVARDLAGHQNISVTNVYLHASDEQLKLAVEMMKV